MASSSVMVGFVLILLLSCFVLILLLPFDIGRADMPAAVDPIQKVCSSTTYPKTCMECITSDGSRETNDLKDMIESILFCTWSHSAYAHNDAEDLADSCATTPCDNKNMVMQCNSTLFDAQEQFLDAWNSIQSEDFGKTRIELLQARAKMNICTANQQSGQFPRKMIDEMSITKHLQEIATSLLSQLAPIVVSLQT